MIKLSSLENEKITHFDYFVVMPISVILWVPTAKEWGQIIQKDIFIAIVINFNYYDGTRILYHILSYKKK